MAEVVKKYGAGWVLMHSADLETANVSEHIHNSLLNMLETAVSLGINAQNICLDPGIGFGKTMEQNLKIISDTNKIKINGNAYLLGASRKRLIGYAVGDNDLPFKERDFGTVAINTIGVLGGADILRVHNVSATVQAALVTDAIIKQRDDSNV